MFETISIRRMIRIKLLHNAKAGDEDHSGQDMTSLIESKGFVCEYASIKEPGWNRIAEETDLLVVAGGDGSVRKVAKHLLERKLIDKRFPLAIFPLGTANNLAKALNSNADMKQVVSLWKTRSVRKRFDIGRVYGVPKAKFFLEGMGYGLFPGLMKKMKSMKKVINTPEEELEVAIKTFHDMIGEYKTEYCNILVDGSDYSGNYLMAEIMNIRSIGPNLTLAPHADPGDGILEVVLVPEDKRADLTAYIRARLDGNEKLHDFVRVRGRSITIHWHGADCHVDDQLIKTKEPGEVKIEMAEGVIEFLVA